MTIVQNGTLVTPGGMMQADLDMEDGKITAIAPGLPAQGAVRVDASGCWVFPGFLDGSIGKPHDVKPRQAVGDKALRRYLGSMDSVYPQSTDAADHTPTPSLFESILSYPIRFKNAIPFSGGGKSHGFPIVIFHRNKEIIGGFSTGGKI